MFLEPEVMSLRNLFCLTNNPNSIQFMITLEIEKQKMLELAKF